jgi:multidrug transporter EmrE-like cation transporter
MIQVATVVLAACFLLCIAAVISFASSFAAARLLLLFATVAAVVGALEIAMTFQMDGLASWAILFASGAFSCGAIALRKLKDRPTRWVHRFVIYAGYAATFAVMAIAALVLDSRELPGMLSAAALFGIYVAASGCIFLAKTLIVRAMIKRMPEYAASLTAGPEHSMW